MEKEHNWTDSDTLTTVSYNKNRNFVCVEYPAIVKDIDKALVTLGGSETVSKTYLQTRERLACKWRPEDVYCKAAFGERFSTTNLLMKVKMRRKKGDNSGKSCQFKVEVVGSVDTAYKFQGMADFQYLPVVKEKDRYEPVADRIVLNEFVDRYEYLNREVPLFIPPVFFSRFDIPDKDYLFRKSIQHRKQNYENPDEIRPENLIGTVRERRTVYTVFLSFKDDIPQKATDEALKNLRIKYNDPEGEKELEKIFEERPIWSKIGLNHHFTGKKDKLKYLLPMKAFYYMNGPWRCMWVKFAYDPRKDPGSKIYQTVDYRKRKLSPEDPLQIKLKRSNDLIKFSAVKRGVSNTAKITISSLPKNQPEEEASSSTVQSSQEEPEHVYLPHRLPPCRQMSYQICDIKLDEVQKLLHDNTVDVIDEKDGWCSKGAIEKCREIMANRTLEDLRQKGFVKAVSGKKKKRSRRRRTKVETDSDDSDVDDDTPLKDDDVAGIEDDLDDVPGLEEELPLLEDEDEEDMSIMETEILDCV